MVSNNTAKPQTTRESTVKRTSNDRNKKILKAGSVHEKIEKSDEHLDESLHNSDLKMDLAMQIISNDQTVRNDTIQELKEINSQSSTTQAKKRKKLDSVMAAIKKNWTNGWFYSRIIYRKGIFEKSNRQVWWKMLRRIQSKVFWNKSMRRKNKFNCV